MKGVNFNLSAVIIFVTSLEKNLYCVNIEKKKRILHFQECRIIFFCSTNMETIVFPYFNHRKIFYISYILQKKRQRGKINVEKEHNNF